MAQEWTLHALAEYVKTIASKVSDSDIDTRYLVVEEGTNTNWKYRKWGNGTYEAWKEYQATGLTLTTNSAGTYYGTSKTLPYPDFHKTLLNAQASEKPSHSSGVFIYNLSGGESGLVIDYRAHASTTNANCGGFFYILGTYE